MLGSGTSSDETSYEEEDMEVPVDTAATLGLTQKEWVRQPKQITLEDLESRQLAAALSGVMPWILPSDMSELGGEYDACLPMLSLSSSCFLG